MGMAMAYFAYRRRDALAVRSTLRPLLGRRVDGWIGDVVDTAAFVGGRFFLQKFKNHETVICMGGLPDRNNVITLINPVEYFLPETATTKKAPIAPKA